MPEAIRDITKRKRPPAPGAPILVRLQPGLLAELDKWISLQGRKTSRPEAIRHAISGFLADETTRRNARRDRG